MAESKRIGRNVGRIELLAVQDKVKSKKINPKDGQKTATNHAAPFICGNTHLNLDA